MQLTLADIFSIVQQILHEGKMGHAALESIKLELSKRRKKKTSDSVIKMLRSGTQVVLKQFPEKFITSFGESLGKALGQALSK